MKKWCIILLMLLLLTGCSKESEPIDRPHSLEMEYGESAVYAKTSAYEWYWKDGREIKTASVDANAMGVSADTIPYLTAGEDTAIQLNFSNEPDRILVQVYSAEDNYAAATEVTVVGSSMPAPTDDGDYLYSVSAVWLEDRDGDGWGSCTYRFFFLAEGAAMSNPVELEIAADLELSDLLQMEDSQVLGVEFLNNTLGATRTCRSAADKSAILAFFRNNLTGELQPVGGSAPQSEYALRFVTVSGSQLTVSYAGGSAPCLTVGGMPYAVVPLDMASLWDTMEAGVVFLHAAAEGKNYLDMKETFPGEDWGSEYVCAYLTQMDQVLTYDEVRILEDASMPDGYRLENGWAGQTAELAENCQFWVLEEGLPPYCRVSSEDFWVLAQDAGSDAIFRIYTSDGQVTAVCQEILD